MSEPADDHDDARSDDATDDQRRREPHRQVRRTPRELTGEERQFLERHRADRPPHHDSSWG